MATDVTFDTNMWKRLANESKRRDHKDRLQIERVLRRIETDVIDPFFCDATVFESVDRNRRKGVLQELVDPDMQAASSAETGENFHGMPLMRTTFVMQNMPDLTVNEHWQNDIKAALDLGFLFIRSRVPAFGGMVVDLDLGPSVYKNSNIPSNSELMDRFMAAQDELDRHGVGMSHIRTKVGEALEISLEKVNMLEIAVLSENQVKASVSEWMDTLLVCAHYAYGHPYLCTLDDGGGAGTKSVMHRDHRSWLKDFGITILDAKELADQLTL